VVLGAPTLEDAAGMNRFPGIARAAARLALLALLAFPAVAVAAGPATDRPGPPDRTGSFGLLWGRLSVEQESPDGPWTHLSEVEVKVYPYVPETVAQLERIRDSLRGSGTEYETAVGRLKDVLAALETRVVQAAAVERPPAQEVTAAMAAALGAGPAEAYAPRPDTSPSVAEGPVRRRVTDAAGLFVFENLPGGEWLLVALRVTPYRIGSDPRRTRRAGDVFLPRVDGGPAKNAEIWLTRVSVPPGERVRVILTDRARWMAGPLREGATSREAPEPSPPAPEVPPAER
jgi:hypothetical protein